METITAYAVLFIKFVRHGIQIGMLRHGLMKAVSNTPICGTLGRMADIALHLQVSRIVGGARSLQAVGGKHFPASAVQTR